MLTLFLDLDNTTIYSKRRVTDTSAMVVVEHYNGEPLSYMTKKSYALLEELCTRKGLQIVPITTRVDYQFDRILLPRFKYAILGNGSELRVNGKVDDSWRAESELYRDYCKSKLIEAYTFLQGLAKDDELVRFANDMFIFGKFKDSDRVIRSLNDLNLTNVSVLRQGRKVYILPKEFDKGYSINRFKCRFETGKVISAGDEVLDFPMADFSDVFITSNSKCVKSNTMLVNSAIFSDDIFDYVRRLL